MAGQTNHEQMPSNDQNMHYYHFQHIPIDIQIVQVRERQN